MSLPDGYDTWVGERGMTLSGGQKQRVAIARTLLMDPRILVLDDSTSAVDMETEYLIQQALAELIKGRTSFVIAHRLRTVKQADQIIVLQTRAASCSAASTTSWCAQPGLYQEIYRPAAAGPGDDAMARPRSAAQTGDGGAIMMGRWRLGHARPGARRRRPAAAAAGRPAGDLSRLRGGLRQGRSTAALMRRLWRYVAPYKLRIAVGGVLLLLYTGATVLNPLIPGLAIDAHRGTATRDGAGLMSASVFLANNTVLWLRSTSRSTR